jgi:hypothetical protein
MGDALMTELMLPSGVVRWMLGDALDATIKMPSSYPALTSSFEMVVPAGFDVGADMHARHAAPSRLHMSFTIVPQPRSAQR